MRNGGACVARPRFPADMTADSGNFQQFSGASGAGLASPAGILEPSEVCPPAPVFEPHAKFLASAASLAHVLSLASSSFWKTRPSVWQTQIQEAGVSIGEEENVCNHGSIHTQNQHGPSHASGSTRRRRARRGGARAPLRKARSGGVFCGRRSGRSFE